MHSICIENQKNLIVKFESTNDYDVDYSINEYLEEAGCAKNQNAYVYSNHNPVEFEKRIVWIAEYFIEKFGKENVDLCGAVKDKLNLIQDNKESFDNAKIIGKEIKNRGEHSPNTSTTFVRKLMDYQKESVEHMMQLGNAANFSVPGSGKTTIAYAAISKWLEDKIIEKIFVIGPTASFLPWEEEYKGCFGKKPRSCRISGDVASQFYEMGSLCDLFLMHFNTAMNRQWELQKFMQSWKTVLIIDESHYIKSPKLRRWASTAMQIAPYAERRIVLSGTPMPNNAKDLWTQITFLWPTNFPLGNQMIYNNYVEKHGGIGKYQSVLDSLFCRIKKDDLHLPRPKWHFVKVRLNARQQEIYDFIAVKTLKEIDELTIHDQAKLQKFRIAKMVRLLQTASNPSLLYEKSSTFDIQNPTFSEEFGLARTIAKLPKIDPSIIDAITKYSQHEVPSKMVKAQHLAKELVEKGNKVIIWNSFIHNMSIFKDSLLSSYDPIVINGTTPKNPSDPDNRDELINKFKNDPASKILIASPASLGESISLHKNSKNEPVCNHAIYLDRNFNGAQYMQSMDRIHRIGMDQSSIVNYHVIIAQNTIDEVVDMRLKVKWQDMLDALQDDMLDSLDINPEPEIINPAEFKDDYEATIDYLRKLYQSQ